jgi:hypothetical protein
MFVVSVIAVVTVSVFAYEHQRNLAPLDRLAKSAERRAGLART